jgi:poly(A) polymerase
MRTSEEIYHRVRWDPRFDPARFVLGVNVRGAEPKRVPLPAFVPGGDIPWHRVLFVEADGELVWDRATGVDALDASEAGRVRAPRLLRAPFFTAATPHAWDPSHGWVPARPRGTATPAVRIVTWNTLWDRYDSDRIDTARRRPLLLAALAAADADVIALQEVQGGLVRLLAAESWVRERYTIGTDPSRHTIDDYGVVLLSRLPVLEAATHAFGPHKAVVAVTVDTGTGPLVVLNVHLTSDHSEDGAGRRRAELTRLAAGLSGVAGPVVVAGDYNDGGDTAVEALGLHDAWTVVRGAADRTATFDPGRNPLAAVSSSTGRVSRLDRVLVRGAEFVPTGAGLVGDEPVAGLFPSDHFGVRVDLVARPHLEQPVEPTTARTAVAWLPPPRLWPAIQRIRAAHDPQVDRWPPHVNLLFGFVPESSFDAAVPRLAEAVRGIAPFRATLAGVRSFGVAPPGATPDDSTVRLDPAAGDPAPWADLRAALERAFPQCRGRLGRATEPGRPAADSARQLRENVVEVGEIVLLSRRGDEPMQPRVKVALGSGNVEWQQPSPVPMESFVDSGAVVTRVRAAAPEAVVSVVGSRRLGCALPGADLDLVAAVPGAADLTVLRDRMLAAFPEAAAVRPVLGARVPGLRLHLPGLAVDLVVVGTGAMPAAQAVARRAELGAAAAVALSAGSDADAILRAAPDSVDLAREVKAWARERGLDSAPFGGLPGVAWCVLAARTPGRTLPDFFATWAAWDWREPVGLAGVSGVACGPLTVLTPSAPVRSCTEQVSAGMRDLLVEELFQSWDGGPRVSPHRRHAAWAVVTVDPGRGEELAGRVRGRLRTLLSLLAEAGMPDLHAWPRPLADGRYAIGLGRTPCDAGRLADLSAGWARGLPGVRVTHAANGDLPTLPY